MEIQKVIHVHIQSQQKRVKFSGINCCFFIRLRREDTFISVQKWPIIEYRLYVFISVDNFIKFSTHNQLTQN